MESIDTSNTAEFEDVIEIDNNNIIIESSPIESPPSDSPTKDTSFNSSTVIALNNIGQFKLEGTPFGSSVVYLDNIYFWLVYVFAVQ